MFASRRCVLFAAVLRRPRPLIVKSSAGRLIPLSRGHRGRSVPLQKTGNIEGTKLAVDRSRRRRDDRDGTRKGHRKIRGNGRVTFGQGVGVVAIGEGAPRRAKAIRVGVAVGGRASGQRWVTSCT